MSGRKERRSTSNKMFNSKLIHLTSIDSTRKTLRLLMSKKFKKLLRRPISLKMPTKTIKVKMS